VNHEFTQAQVRRITGGVTRPKVTLADFRSLRVLVPPVREQTAALAVCDAADEAIRGTETVIAKLHKMRLGLQDDLVSGTSTSCTKFIEYVHASAFGPRFPADAYDPHGNVATLRTTDLDDEGNLDLAGMPRARLSEAQFRSHLLEPGDLLITRSGTCGIASVFPGFGLPVVPGAFLLRFRLNERVLPQYARYYFNSRAGRAQLLGEAEGGVQKNIRGSSVLRLRVPFPPMERQRRAVAVLDSIADRLRAEEAYLAKLTLQKQGLMHDLLTGRVRVNARSAVS
jgi:type I restriction enzyme S subunit